MTLRVAIPNKGSLSVEAVALLADAGYRVHGHRELRVIDTDNDIIFFFQRPKDIATYVGTGTLEVGITGQDLLVDSGAPAEAILELGFARSQFRFAAPPDTIHTLDQLHDKRVATSFPRLVAKYLADHGVQVRELVRLDGAVENAIELGVADAIADVVETGSTMRAAGLEVFGETVLDSQAVLVTRAGAVPPGFEIFVRRVQGVLVARSYVMMDYAIADVVETGESLRSAGLLAFGEPMMTSQAILIQSTRQTLSDEQAKAIKGLTNRLRGVLNSRLYVIMDYDCPRDVLAHACELTPGKESPTISPLGKDDWVAVRSLVRSPDVQPIMDALEEIGCKAILVTPLQACRL
jgi:ATP phosphoribosyltransferase